MEVIGMSAYYDPPDPSFINNHSSSKLYFIGKQKSPRDIQIANIPSFYDALQLLKFNHLNYSSVPLTTEKHVKIRFTERHSPLSFFIKMEPGKLVIEIQEKQGATSTRTAHEIINCFLLQYNRYCCFLLLPPRRKIKLRKRDRLRVLAESAALDTNVYLFTRSVSYCSQENGKERNLSKDNLT